MAQVDLAAASFARTLLAGGSESRDAIVVAALANNRYTVSDVTTDTTYSATGGQPNVTYAVGKRVIVRHDASGRATGRPPVIIGYALASENGAISGTLNVTGTATGATFLQMPERLTLIKGGVAVRLTVYGFGFTSGATYGSANIVDSMTQSVESEVIVIQPSATSSAVVGRYSLTLNGVVFTDYIEVVA